MSKDKSTMDLGKGGIVKLVLAVSVTAVVITAIIFIFVIPRLNQQSDVGSLTEASTPKRNVVTRDNVDEVIKQEVKDDIVAPQYYEVTMNTTWDFADGESASSNAYVANSTYNTTDVYFDVVLTDTEEIIYSSPVLPIGEYINDITLDKALDAGTYDCTVIYSLIDGEQNPLSTVRVALTIVVNG